jgi:arginyl-tRNA synthetase
MSNEEQDLKEIKEWRASVTLILQQQTQILSALQQDFREHEEKEELYQEKVAAFMLESVRERTMVATRTEDVKIDFEKFHAENAKQHQSIVDKLDVISNKVWLAIGAVIIYAPVVSFLAVELFKHLTSHK